MKILGTILFSFFVAFLVSKIPYIAEVLRYEIHGMLTVAIFVILIFIYKELLSLKKNK